MTFLGPVTAHLSAKAAAAAAAAILSVGAIAAYAATDGFTFAPEPSPSGVASAAPAGSASASVAPVASAGVQPAGDEEAVTISGFPGGGGGGRNVVVAVNQVDDRLMVRGSIQLNRIPAPNAAPENLARAYSSCTNCQTLAVAMQINLISRETFNASPQNAAVAINFQCSGCRTIAVALQYTISVDDPRDTPRAVRDLVREMDAELRLAAREATDLADAVRRVNAVIERYQELVSSLDDQRAETTEETTPGAVEETPTPGPSPSGSTSPSTTSPDSPPDSSEPSASPAPTP